MFVVCLAADKSRKCKLVMSVTPDDVNGVMVSLEQSGRVGYICHHVTSISINKDERVSVCREDIFKYP